MPLPFESKSHGTIAFGFFNIETDLLLLARTFFFATDFCAAVGRLADGAVDSVELPAFSSATPEAVGDLMGAIHGVRHTGFIGALYRRFPFPGNPDGFRQQPEGEANQELVRSLIAGFASPATSVIEVGGASDSVRIDEITFSADVFRDLIRYVWRGGYPRWRDEERPACVLALRDRIATSDRRLFQGLRLG